MNDLRNLRNALLRNGDVIVVFLWVLIFSAVFVRSILSSGPSLDQLKYLFFSIIAFLICTSFRVSSRRPEQKAKLWGLINVNIFGILMIFKEFLNE